MYYGSIKPCDIANGTGVRVTLFVSGCTHRCKGCFQPQTWDFRYGQPFTAETEEALLEALNRPYISGLTLLGGEPFEPDNQRALLPFLHRLRQQLPDKTVWAFSGYTWEEPRKRREMSLRASTNSPSTSTSTRESSAPVASQRARLCPVSSSQV